MPGYAKSTGGSSKSAIFSNSTQVYSEKFYGISINLQTGDLLVNEVDNKSEVITIPSVEESFAEEYLYWLWSGTKLKFYWDQQTTTRLLMEVT
jgi:hypothetical protein